MNLKSWIQNISEEKEDFLIENGKVLDSLDEASRRSYVDKMFILQDNGKKVFSNSVIKIYKAKKDNSFLVQLNAENKDIYERRVAVMIFIENYNFENNFKSLVKKNMNATTPKTVVSDETIHLIQEVVNKSKKKVPYKKIGVIIGGIIALIIFLKKLMNL